MNRDEVDRLTRAGSWEGVRAVVLGFGASGFAAADNLNHLGAQVTALADSATEEQQEKAELLRILGATVRIEPDATATLPDEVDVVVTSPGFRPDSPLLVQAAERDVPVWGEVELAWRLRDPERPAPWLVVTGTNGKTTTVQMLDAILRAEGLNSLAVGNVGLPIVEAVMDPAHYDVLAVELSSYQLHYTSSMQAHSAAVLNLAEDHLDWYQGIAPDDPYAAYAADKAKVYHDVSGACVYNLADPATEEMVREADVIEGARAIGFTLGMPGVGMLGLVDDILVDRAFIEQRASSAAELCTVDDLASRAPHFIANALAAAALARSFGVSQQAVRDGLSGFRPDQHRIAEVAEADEVTWIDDSKATNPHAARSSLQAYASVVWVAGGLAKGASFDSLVTDVAGRLRAAVLIGSDRDVIADALSRHAPDVPVFLVPEGETGLDLTGPELMREVVRCAAKAAKPGDVVLLAPGCASMDQFDSYAQRGELFADAVREWIEQHGS